MAPHAGVGWVARTQRVLKPARARAGRRCGAARRSEQAAALARAAGEQRADIVDVDARRAERMHKRQWRRW